MFSGALKAGLTVQRVTCMCMGVGLAVRRVLCTSIQLAWTCRESFARSSFREIQSIDILVPKIWYHAPHPSNDQNMSKTTSFQRQKRGFLDGFRFPEFWWFRFPEFCCWRFGPRGGPPTQNNLHIGSKILASRTPPFK